MSGPSSDTDSVDVSTGGHTEDPEATRELSDDPVFAIDRAELDPGAPFGRYVILRELGRGGMAVVYLAYDPKLDRRVALKLIRRGSTERRSASEARLEREARALARLSHPNVVHVYDAGVRDGHAFVSMELVEGETLRSWLRAERRAPAQTLPILLKAAEGLAAAHDAGLVHFDFKPSNVLLGEDRVRVADFGLAREPRGADGDDASEDVSAELPVVPASGQTRNTGPLEALTQHGAIMGTPGYIAPEHLRGDRADARADQFSFCVTVWEALYDEHPFGDHDRSAKERRMAAGKIGAPPTTPGVPSSIETVLRKGLAPDPADRFSSMRSLLAALKDAGDRPQRRRRLVLYAAGAVAVAGLGALAFDEPAAAQCADGRGRLRSAWEGEPREAVRIAFGQSRAPFAEDTLRTSITLLDAYTEEWSEMYVAACETTLPDEANPGASPLDRRMACLRTAEIEFDALVSIFAEADERTVENAVVAVGALPPIDHCADDAVLADVVDLPLSPEQASVVAELEATFARADVLRASARFVDAVELSAPAMARAEAAEHAPSIARGSAILGAAYAGLGQVDKARAVYLRGLEAAERVGMDYVRALILAEMVFVYGTLSSDFETGRWFADAARAALTRIGARATSFAHVDGNEAVVATSSGNPSEGAELAARALKLREEGGEPLDENHAALLINLGGALYSSGRFEEALEKYGQAHQINLDALGPNHPALSISHQNLGNAMQALGRFDEALLQHARALAIGRALQIEGFELATQLSNVGVVLSGLQRFEEARGYYEEALEMWTEDVVDHPNRAVVECNLGEVELSQDNYPEAEALYRHALAQFERQLGKSHPFSGLAAAGLGQARLGQGDIDEAITLLRRAVDVHERQTTDPLFLSEARLFLGMAIYGRDEVSREAGREMVEAARVELEAMGDKAERQVGIAKRWLRRHRP